MKILVYPLYENPYQELLYTPLRKEGIKIRYLNKTFFNIPLPLASIFFPLLCLVYRILGFNIFHLHWQNFVISSRNNFFKKISFKQSLLNIKIIKKLGFKLIWTVHNLVPHEEQTSNDLEISRTLCKLSDAKIVHSYETLKEMRKHGFNTKNSFVIPIGNYISAHPNNSSKKNSLKKLGIKNNNLIFLFFGIIRKYKGVDNLINSYTKTRFNKKTKLIIAGKCQDGELKKLLDSCRSNPNIIIHDHFIENEDVQNYLNSADIIVCPFKKITTSSTALLSFSFGKPIICPKMGNLTDLPRDACIFYNSKDKNGLKKAIIRATNLDNEKLKDMGKMARLFAEENSWDKITEKTFGIYKEVITNGN